MCSLAGLACVTKFLLLLLKFPSFRLHDSLDSPLAIIIMSSCLLRVAANIRDFNFELKCNFLLWRKRNKNTNKMFNFSRCSLHSICCALSWLHRTSPTSDDCGVLCRVSKYEKCKKQIQVQDYYFMRVRKSRVQIFDGVNFN